MAEEIVCPYCSLPLHCAPEDHFPSCPNVFKCVSCQELLRTDLQEAHVSKCRYTLCSFCKKAPGEGGLEVHVPRCLAASKCSKCGEFVPAAKKYLHETKCRSPAPIAKVAIECDICHSTCDNLSKGYSAYDDHMMSHSLQTQENEKRKAIYRSTVHRERAVPMRKCEFCEGSFPLESIETHKKSCLERASCGQCLKEMPKKLLDAHFQACLPLQRQSFLDSIALEGPVAAPFTAEMQISAPRLASRPKEMPKIERVEQEEEEKQPQAARPSAPVQETMIWCELCKSSVDARCTL